MQVSEITAFLEHAYDVLNREWFGGELPRVVITVQSTPRCFGHYTPWKSWANEKEEYNEINLGAETIDRELCRVISTLIHEMTHHYCNLKGIKDVSRGGTYHNKRFKEVAEAHGLIIDYDPRIGYSVTTPSPELIAFVEEQGWSGITLARKGSYGASGGGTDGVGGGSGVDGIEGFTGKKKSSTRKYQCPVCGCSVRATKVVNIGCLDCGCPMELVEK